MQFFIDVFQKDDRIVGIDFPVGIDQGRDGDEVATLENTGGDALVIDPQRDPLKKVLLRVASYSVHE